MDKKFYVPFETAKLLKEKGYPEYADIFYDANGFLVNNFSRSDYDAPIVLPVISSPTYHEVLDWLYEKKICITCHPAYSYEGQYNGFQYEMQTYDEDDYPDDIYRTREEALNEAIKAALHMI